MDVAYLRQLLEQVAEKKTNIDEALTELKKLPYEDIGYANIDQHRNLRTGQGEVIFGQGKTPEQIAGIVSHMRKGNKKILITRADEKDYEKVLEAAPDAVFEREAGIIIAGGKTQPDPSRGRIAILTCLSYTSQNRMKYYGYTNTGVLEGARYCNDVKVEGVKSVLSPEEIARVKGLGFLQDKQTPDCFNARVITRNGKISAQESRVLAQAAERFGSGEITMTTRLTVAVSYTHLVKKLLYTMKLTKQSVKICLPVFTQEEKC